MFDERTLADDLNSLLDMKSQLDPNDLLNWSVMINPKDWDMVRCFEVEKHDDEYIRVYKGRVIELDYFQWSHYEEWAVGYGDDEWPDMDDPWSSERMEGFITGWHQLGGTLPAQIGNLTGLKYLSLQGVGITGPLPTSLGNLINLRRLYLCDNQITGSLPSSLGNLSKLKVLDIRDNQLTGSIPDSLGCLKKLEQLRLYNNRLSGGIPTALGNCSCLESLGLADNQLTGSIPWALGDCTCLCTLNLANNQLTGNIPQHLENADLGRLLLAGNQLSGCIPANIIEKLRLPERDSDGSLLRGRDTLSLSGNNFDGRYL